MVVKVSVAVPALISSGEGKYSALKLVLLGTKVPFPVQLAAEPNPLSFTGKLLVQTVWSGPASTVGIVTKLMEAWSEMGKQAPLPVVVSVKFTIPFDLSAGEGVYTAFNVVLSGVNSPEPEEVQIPPEATVTMPFSCTDFVLPHTVMFVPASTVGDGLVIVMVVWSVTLLQLPFPVDIRVKETLSFAISEDEGV
jgi:hypothetical protein